MRGTVINIEQELDQLQNDERLINRYILEKYPQLSNYRLRTIERIFKICSIFVQATILFINRNDNFCPNEDSDFQSKNEVTQDSYFTNYLESITKCSQQKSNWLSILTGALLMIIGLWLVVMKYYNRQLFLKPSVQILFLILVIMVQISVFEIYLFRFISYFWTVLLSIQLVLLIDKYIKPLKIGLIGQVFSVFYIQMRFYIQYKVDHSQIIVGLLIFTLLILQTFSNKVLYRNKLQILQITRNQLNSVRSFYNDLLGLIPQGLTLLDSSQNIIYANSRVTEILQCDEQDIFSILMNLSNNNNNAKKNSTLVEVDQQSRPTRHLTASINAGLAGTSLLNAPQGGGEFPQNMNSAQSRVQMNSFPSKQFNSQMFDDYKSSPVSKSCLGNTTPGSGVPQQVAPGKNQVYQQINNLNDQIISSCQQNWMKGIQQKIKKEEYNTVDSPQSYFQQDKSFIQTESLISMREFNNGGAGDITTNNDNSINHSNLNNTHNQSFSKYFQHTQSKFGVNQQKPYMIHTYTEHIVDNQYTLGADNSLIIKENNFGNDSSSIALKDNQDQSFHTKEIKLITNFQNDHSEITTTPLKQKQHIQQLKINVGSSSPKKICKAYSYFKTSENQDSLTPHNKSPVKYDDFKKQHDNSIFFAEQNSGTPTIIPCVKGESLYMNSGITEKNENGVSMNLIPDQVLGDRTMNCDISTLPFQSTDRRGFLIYGDEAEENFGRDKLSMESPDSLMKYYSEVGNASRTELAIPNNASGDFTNVNLQKRRSSDQKTSINEIQQINQNIPCKLRKETSLVVNQQPSKDGLKEFSFGQNLQFTLSTNHQLTSPKKCQGTYSTIGGLSSAAFLKKEERQSIDEGQSTQDHLTHLQKSYEVNPKAVKIQKCENEQSLEIGEAVMRERTVSFKNNLEAFKNSSFSIEIQQKSAQNTFTPDVDDHESKAQAYQSNLSLMQGEQDSSLQNQELSIFKNNRLNVDYGSQNIPYDDKDKCLTECRKQIQDRTINKRNSRLEKAIKTLEMQDLPKYQEEKNSSLFKQKEDSKKSKEKSQNQNSAKNSKKNNSSRFIPEKSDSKKSRKISHDIQALILSPSSQKIKKEKGDNTSSQTKINSQNNILSTPKPLDSRLTSINRSKADNNNGSTFNPIEAENMSLKKYVISQKESKDLAYKSLFQPKIIKKETKVKNILSKLLTLNKKQKNDADTISEVSGRTKQISQITSNIQDTHSRTEERKNILQIPEAEESDIRSCMTPTQNGQPNYMNIHYLARSKTDQFLKYKDDTFSNNSNIGPTPVSIENSKNQILNSNTSGQNEMGSINFGFFSKPLRQKNQTIQFYKEKSPTVGYSLDHKKYGSFKTKSQMSQKFKLSQTKNENEASEQHKLFSRNKGRKESFFNQFNKEANIDQTIQKEPMVLVLIDPVWQEFLNKQIEDMNRYKMRMFASLSHELRTPLNCSISMLEFLESDIISMGKQAAQLLANNIQRQQRLETSQNLIIGTSHQQIQQPPQMTPLNSSNQLNQLNVNQNIMQPNQTNQLNESSEENLCSLNSIQLTSLVKTTNNLNALGGAQNNISINNNNPQASMHYNNSGNNFQSILTEVKAIQEECDRVIQSYLKPALHSSKLLLNLINDILDFVQIDSGKFKFTFIQFSLEQLLHECIVLINLQAKSKNIELQVDFDQSIPKKIESDPNRIRQVLLNFLSNALKFTVQGKIIIQASMKPLTNNLILLSVIDTGIGISEKDIRNIFTIFNKVDLGKNQQLNSQGCGLGLTLSNSISKGLAPESVGGVQVESKIGEGSKFSFIIEDHSASKQYMEQSCDVLESEEDESYRPKTITENFRKQFKSPSFSQLFEGGQYLAEQISPMLSSQTGNHLNSAISEKQTPNNLMPSPYQQSNFVQNKYQNLNYQSNNRSPTPYGLNISQKGEKDIHMIKQILSENGKCNCVQILAADDNEFNLIVVENILRKSHLKSDNACNGQIAYQKIIQRRQQNSCCPDYKLILMDIEMPIMNGYQTSQQIYELYQNEGIPEKRPYIVACTAYVGEDEKNLAKLNCMDDFVTKPIQSTVLEQVLIRFVSYYLKNNLKNRD